MSILNATEFSKFCLISGKPELREFLLKNSTDSVLLDLLYEPMIWEQVWEKEAGRYSLRFGNEEAAIAQIKLSFLLYLWNDYSEADGLSDILRKLLGENPIHYTVFDKWWILSRPTHENSREVEKTLIPEAVAAFDKTGFPETDEWLENLKSKT